MAFDVKIIASQSALSGHVRLPQVHSNAQPAASTQFVPAIRPGMEVAENSACPPNLSLWKNGDFFKAVYYGGKSGDLKNWIRDNYPGCVQGQPYHNLPVMRRFEGV
jgi:hypothetical protein